MAGRSQCSITPDGSKKPRQCRVLNYRDINAAKNIKSFGLHRQNLSYNKYREGLSRINAQGDCFVGSVGELRSDRICLS